MKNRVLVRALLVVLFFSQSATAHTPDQRKEDLANELKERFDPEWIEDIFNHQNLCEGRDVPQRELSGWWELSKSVMSEESIEKGIRFFRRNEAALRKAAGIDDCEDLPFVILAILRIESYFGENRAGTPVPLTLFKRYHRVKDGPSGNAGRAYVLEKAVIPFFESARENGWDVCEIRGSRAAAFGYPHFIPDSLRFAVDGDGDGKKDIVWSLPDSASSIANYLVRNGYPRNHKLAIYRYNHDSRYVNIVWAYAKKVRSEIE